MKRMRGLEFNVKFKWQWHHQLSEQVALELSDLRQDAYFIGSYRQG